MTAVRESLKTMPPIVQVTKESHVKMLQQRVNKAWERHHRRIVQLDQFHKESKQLELKYMEGLTKHQGSMS